MTSLIREAYPRNAAKLSARAADVPHETARNWVQGRAIPSAATLLRWADNCDAMASALERRLHDRRMARAAAAAAGQGAAAGGEVTR